MLKLRCTYVRAKLAALGIGAELPLPPNARVTLGRSAACDVVVPVAGLAAHRHVIFESDANGVVTMTGSGHGAQSPRLDGSLVSRATRLEKGGVVEILTESGELLLAFVAQEA